MTTCSCSEVTTMNTNDGKPTANAEYRTQSLHVGVRDAKANLSRLLREVKSGRDVIITEYGRPIARLVPIRTLSLADRLAEMEARGDIVSQKPVAVTYQPVRIPEGLAQRYLQEDREGRKE